MTIKERIYEFISTIKTNNFAFEKKCGLSRGYLEAIKSDIGSSKLEQILRAYPEISPAWLILGEGPMFISQASQKTNGDENQAQNANSGDNRELNNPKKYDFDVKGEIVQLRQDLEQIKALLQVKNDEINFYRATIADALKGRKSEE